MNMKFMKQFDTKANSEDGAKLHFKTPDGELAYIDYEAKKPCKPLTVTMLGASSDAHQAYQVKAINKLRISEKGKKKSKGVELLSDEFFEDTIEEQAEKLASVCVSWENVLGDDDKELSFTKANVKKVFTQYGELREQAVLFLVDSTNFTQGYLKA